MASDEVKDTITEVYALAQKLALTGTPSYVTSGEVAIGAIGSTRSRTRSPRRGRHARPTVC